MSATAATRIERRRRRLGGVFARAETCRCWPVFLA